MQFWNYPSWEKNTKAGVGLALIRDEVGNRAWGSRTTDTVTWQTVPSNLVQLGLMADKNEYADRRTDGRTWRAHNTFFIFIYAQAHESYCRTSFSLHFVVALWSVRHCCSLKSAAITVSGWCNGLRRLPARGSLSVVRIRIGERNQTIDTDPRSCRRNPNSL